MSNHVSVVGIFQNLAPQLQLYYFDIAITNANIIAIFRLYLGFGTACVVGRPGPMSPNTAQARAGRPRHSLNCTSSLSCSKWPGSWGVLVGHPTECEKPFSETGVIWPWRSLTFFLALGDDFRHFFGLFPSAPIVTPKMPGVVIIKGPLTARKKIYMSPIVTPKMPGVVIIKGPFSELFSFWALWVVLGHFFGLFPSVSMVTPKTPGAVIIKAPVTALKKKCMTPGPSIRPFWGLW